MLFSILFCLCSGSTCELALPPEMEVKLAFVEPDNSFPPILNSDIKIRIRNHDISHLLEAIKTKLLSMSINIDVDEIRIKDLDVKEKKLVVTKARIAPNDLFEVNELKVKGRIVRNVVVQILNETCEEDLMKVKLRFPDIDDQFCVHRSALKKRIMPELSTLRIVDCVKFSNVSHVPGGKIELKIVGKKNGAWLVKQFDKIQPLPFFDNQLIKAQCRQKIF